MQLHHLEEMYRNARYMCIILVANIIWRSGHAIRSSFLLDIYFLRYSCRRVLTVFYGTAVQHDRFGRALKEDPFWPSNVILNAQKNGQGELARR